MIKREYYNTRKDGRELYRTYSDEGFKIIKDGTDEVYDEAIDVQDFTYSETCEPVGNTDGAPVFYDEIAEAKRTIAKAEAFIARTSDSVNYMDLTDNQSVELAEHYPSWEECVGRVMMAGYITRYGGLLYRARQMHTPLAVYPPSIDTAALYEVVVYQHEGTMEDPIPYTPPMEIYEGKYYTQFGVLYKCTRDSGTALAHDLFDLRGLYVELIER